MARQQTASDEQILQAALRVIVRRGHQAFTLSDVAEEVGLSRAAIILRFKGTQGLKVSLTAYIVERFVHLIRSLPVSRSGDGLLGFVAFIGGMISTPGSLSAFMRTYHFNVKDEQLAELEHRRTEAMREAISQRMPSVAISHDSAVSAFFAHIGGSLMQWEVMSGPDARFYLVERTKEWLTLTHIAHDKHFSAASIQSGAAA